MIMARHVDPSTAVENAPCDGEARWPTARRLVQEFRGDARGSVMVIFGMMLVPVVFFVGMGIDYAKTSHAHSTLQAAADAAALATLNAPGLADADRIILAQSVFATNVAGNALLGNITPTVDFSQGPTVVTAGKDVPTSFVKIVGIDTMRIDVKASATNAAAASNAYQLEVAMMIDLTGSMGQNRNGTTKIQGLQDASADFLNILFPNGAMTSSTTRVAIAPMADFVNAGNYAAQVTGLSTTGAFSKLGNLAASKTGSYGALGYSGAGGGSGGFGATSSGATYSSTHCASGTQYQVVQGYTVGTASANGSAFGSYASYWKTVGSTIYYLLNSGSYNPVSSANCTVAADQTGTLISCVTERVGGEAYTDAAAGTGTYIGAYNQGRSATAQNYSADGKCYVAGRELPAVIPLTNDRAMLDTFFANVTVGGGTPGHLGHAWAWYMLSPIWSSVWPSSSEPLAYTTPGLTKAAVIMTDGEYNEQYSSATSRTQALALCAAMKAKGIKVFTIGFGFAAAPANGSTEGNAKDLLTQCASAASFAYFPYDGVALRQAFQTIGTSLTTVTATARARVSN